MFCVLGDLPWAIRLELMEVDQLLNTKVSSASIRHGNEQICHYFQYNWMNIHGFWLVFTLQILDKSKKNPRVRVRWPQTGTLLEKPSKREG